MKQVRILLGLVLCFLVMPLQGMDHEESGPEKKKKLDIASIMIGSSIANFFFRSEKGPMYNLCIKDKEIKVFDEQNLVSMAFLGKVHEVKKLLDDGVSVDQRDAEGCTALHRAAQEGRLNIIELLLKHGAFDPDQVDNNGITALGHAAGNGRHLAIALLVEAIQQYKGYLTEVSIDSPLHIKKRKTPLYCAIGNGYFSMADYLIKSEGARADIPDEDGITPLHLAVQKCADTDEKFISSLIKKCMTVKLQDNKGNTPLSLAQQLKKPVIAQLLSKAEAKYQ